MFNHTVGIPKMKDWKLKILVLYMIYISDTVFFYTNINRSITTGAKISIVILAIILVIQVIIKNKGRLSSKGILFILLTLIFLTLGMLTNGIVSFGYFMKAVLIISGIIIAKNIDFIKFSKVYVDIMIFLALYSLIFYFLYRNFDWAVNIISNYAQTIQNNGGFSFYNLIFTNIPVDRYSSLRNWGIFWEPEHTNFSLT